MPLSTITPGAILYLNESGSPVPFYIAKHDYESGLNGAGRTLVVRKDCYNSQQFNTYASGLGTKYANSSLDSLLNNTYFKLLDAAVRTMIGETKFYYTVNSTYTTVTTLQRAVFQLSFAELGRSASYANTEGSALPIASMLRIAYRNGEAVTQWTRTPVNDRTAYICYLTKAGNSHTYSYDGYNGSRPAFTLPGTLALAQNTDGTYTLAA